MTSPAQRQGARPGDLSQTFVARPALEDALASALQTPGGVLLLGEAGAGKTRLAEHILRQHHHLAVSCACLSSATARDAVATLLQKAEPRPQELIRLLLGGSAGAGPAPDGDLLLRAAGHAVAALVPPVCVFIDDAEVLPDAEVQALANVVSTSERPWIFASRRRLANLPLRLLEVPQLSPVEAAGLVDRLLPGAPDDIRSTVLERGGGSPHFLVQCAQLMLENGALGMVDGRVHVLTRERVADVPRSIRAFVGDRLDLLSQEESSVLGIAAVLGTQADLALVRFLAGGRAERVNQLVDRGLLRLIADEVGQPCVRFTHGMVRDAAYDRVPLADRIATHRAAAEWYAVLPVSQVLESQAYHLEAAVRLEEADCDLLRRAVDAMVLYARSIEEERTQVSHEVLSRAKALVAARRDCDVDQLDLQLALASVSFVAGREDESAQAAALALSLAEGRGEVRAIAEARLSLARVVIDADPERALRELDLAEASYAQVDDPGGRARVEVTRGFVRQHQDGVAQQLAGLERSYHLAMRSADTRLQASCAQQLALHQAIASGRVEYEMWAERARESSRKDDLALGPRLQAGVAVLADLGLDPVPALDVAKEALAAGLAFGLRDVCANALLAKTSLELLAGELEAAREGIRQARSFAMTRPTEWWGLQLNLVEARLRARSGDQPGAQDLLSAVAGHELAGTRVLQHDLAEARAWISLERGRFGEARALAAEAVAIDLETGERCPQLRPRLVELVATVAAGENVSLGTIADLRSLSRDTGLGTIAQLATRWLYVDELTRGWSVDLHGVQPCEVIECRALDLEIEALSSRRWQRLLDAAEVWAELGTTVWHARALLWHSELTGTPSPDADELLVRLDSPDGLAELLRAQVRGLRG